MAKRIALKKDRRTKGQVLVDRTRDQLKASLEAVGRERDKLRLCLSEIEDADYELEDIETELRQALDSAVEKMSQYV